MEMRRLGAGGLAVGAMGLGCMGITHGYVRPEDIDEPEGIATIQRALDRGVTLLDTADVYGGEKDRSFTGVGATIHVGILVDVNVRPMQAVDFILGIFTIDVLDDDYGKAVRNKDL